MPGLFNIGVTQDKIQTVYIIKSDLSQLFCWVANVMIEFKFKHVFKIYI